MKKYYQKVSEYHEWFKRNCVKKNLIYPDTTLPNIIDVVRTIYTYCGANEKFIINDLIKTGCVFPSIAMAKYPQIMEFMGGIVIILI